MLSLLLRSLLDSPTRFKQLDRCIIDATHRGVRSTDDTLFLLMKCNRYPSIHNPHVSINIRCCIL